DEGAVSASPLTRGLSAELDCRPRGQDHTAEGTVLREHEWVRNRAGHVRRVRAEGDGDRVRREVDDGTGLPMSDEDVRPAEGLMLREQVQWHVAPIHPEPEHRRRLRTRVGEVNRAL